MYGWLGKFLGLEFFNMFWLAVVLPVNQKPCWKIKKTNKHGFGHVNFIAIQAPGVVWISSYNFLKVYAAETVADHLLVAIYLKTGIPLAACPCPVQFINLKLKRICIFYHFWTLRWWRYLKPILVERDKDLFVLNFPYRWISARKM